MEEARVLTLPVEGMTCAACAARIEKMVRKVQGVQNINVNLASEKAHVVIEPNTAWQSVVERIQKTGYSVPKLTTEITIHGISASTAATHLQKLLEQQSGVESVVVDPATGRTRIIYVAGITSPTDCIRVVERAGYEAIGGSQADMLSAQEKKKRAYQRDLVLFMASAVVTLPFLIEMVVMAAMSIAMAFSMFDMAVSMNMNKMQYDPNYVMPTTNPFMDWMRQHENLIPSWIALALSTPIQFITGWRFYRGAYHAIRNRTATMDVLVAIGTTIAYMTGLILTFTSPHSNDNNSYCGSAAVIITLVFLGKVLEARAKQKSGAAIESLLQLGAKVAHVVRGDAEVDVAVEDLRIGDIIRVRSGEKVPMDGEIIEGTSMIDESLMTGESTPVAKTVGDLIYGATINHMGVLLIRVTKTNMDNALAQIIRAVDEAQGSKASVQRVADFISAILVPTVLAIALEAFVLWGFWGTWSHALIATISCLVVACPCSVGLATPTAIMVASGLGAEHGILIKSGEYLEVAHKVKTVIFDKTGTLTVGKPVVTDIIPSDPQREKLLLKHAASLEAHSEHPLGRAIVQYADQFNIGLLPVREVNVVSGMGISGIVRGCSVIVGNEALMRKHGILLPDDGSNEQLEAQAKTVVHVASEGVYLGAIAIADKIKDDAKAAIQQLKKMEIDVWLITGDNEHTAKAVANQVDIQNVLYGVLPAEKAQKVEQLKQNGQVIAMVGDGINDAPALAAAHIGIAMGTGADVAIEAADIAIMHSRMKSVPDAIYLSKRAMRTIRINLFWAFFYNAIAVPLAALGAFNPMIAGAAMAFSSVSVVSNSLMLKRIKLGEPIPSPSYFYS